MTSALTSASAIASGANETSDVNLFASEKVKRLLSTRYSLPALLQFSDLGDNKGAFGRSSDKFAQYQ